MVTESSEDMTQVIHKSNNKEFGVVRDRLNSIFDIVSRQASMRHVMREVPSIITEPRARYVQDPLTTIDLGSEEVH